MKRNTLLTLLVAVIVFAMAAPVFASGWKVPPIDTTTGPNQAGGPHMGFSSSTNQCKYCHAVHGANAGSYRLLHNTSRATECDYCHDATTGVSGMTPYDVASPSAQHRVGAMSGAPLTNAAIPDSSLSLPGRNTGDTFNCFDCHSVHGAATVAGNDKILRNNPANTSSTATASTGGTDLYDTAQNFSIVLTTGVGEVVEKVGGASTTVASVVDANHITLAADISLAPGDSYILKAATESQFCAGCHNANGGNVNHIGASHPLTTATTDADVYGQSVQIAWTNTDACTKCHKATAGHGDTDNTGGPDNSANPSNFPHQATGIKFLTDGTSSSNLDSVCGGCHTDTGDIDSYTAGVGASF
jgi:hypothetical protein